jgi:hypothetical protein
MWQPLPEGAPLRASILRHGLRCRSLNTPIVVRLLEQGCSCHLRGYGCGERL